MTLHLLVSDQGLGVDAAGDGVAGGHQVVDVDVLHEGLDAQALLDLLLAHLLGDLERVLVDTSHQAVGVGPALAGALVAVDDDALAARTTAGEHDHDATGLHKLRHPEPEISGRLGLGEAVGAVHAAEGLQPLVPHVALVAHVARDVRQSRAVEHHLVRVAALADVTLHVAAAGEEDGHGVALLVRTVANGVEGADGRDHEAVLAVAVVEQEPGDVDGELHVAQDGVALLDALGRAQCLGLEPLEETQKGLRVVAGLVLEVGKELAVDHEAGPLQVEAAVDGADLGGAVERVAEVGEGLGREHVVLAQLVPADGVVEAQGDDDLVVWDERQRGPAVLIDIALGGVAMEHGGGGVVLRSAQGQRMRRIRLGRLGAIAVARLPDGQLVALQVDGVGEHLVQTSLRPLVDLLVYADVQPLVGGGAREGAIGQHVLQVHVGRRPDHLGDGRGANGFQESLHHRRAGLELAEGRLALHVEVGRGIAVGSEALFGVAVDDDYALRGKQLSDVKVRDALEPRAGLPSTHRLDLASWERHCLAQRPWRWVPLCCQRLWREAAAPGFLRASSFGGVAAGRQTAARVAMGDLEYNRDGRRGGVVAVVRGVASNAKE
ncbi:flagellar export ATPase, putative [Babesia caballi]|uniref:Flagellar export ATPase, putative n=1 Tax=Babesia caballi TaxID=5871 RepID=A0AAV4LV91_BABCB|nr:flagellar export ATPase, putative [Babesia caballi]